MTPEQYYIRAAEFRAHMEKPMEPFSFSSVLGTKESNYLPGGEKRSLVPEKPADINEDLSALNSPSWKKLKAAGKRNGRRPKR